MATTHLLVVVVLLPLLLVTRESRSQEPARSCTTEEDDCGQNSTCLVLVEGSSSGECRCDTFFFSLSGSNRDCKSLSEPEPRCVAAGFDSDCVYCGINYEGPCQRCVGFLFSGNGSCGTSCPGDTEILPIQEIRRSARICTVSASATGLPEWALILIIVVGVIFVLSLSIAGLVLVACCLQRSSRGEFELKTPSDDSKTNTMRTKRSNSFSFKMETTAEDANSSLITKNRVYQENDDDSNDEDVDADDETIFKYKLAKLRKKSEIFLRMLNDMRRRLRELPPDSPVAEQYNNVIRDVTRLLYMLNKKPSKVKMPVDGVQLMRWSENILKRYVASQGEQDLPPSSGRVPSYMEGTISRNNRAFLEKLAYLRDHSEVFLRMLNEMRRRLKELRQDTPTAQNYRAISKDVTRLIELMNKRPSSVEMPPDGLELVKKAERLLDNYLQSQGVSEETEKLGDYGLQDVETEF